jgi:hypothetical protein
MPESFFIAYPSEPELIGDTIEAAVPALTMLTVTTWKQFDQPGRIIHEPVRENIDRSSVVIADVSVANFNVMYEIGYAIARGKKVIPIVNKSLSDAGSYINDLGVLDTMLYQEYENSHQLRSILPTLTARHPLYNGPLPINVSQPCYILDALRRNEFTQRIISIVKRVRLHYRSFDPKEEPRLSTPEALKQVAVSAGVILPLLSRTFDDAAAHNLRAAFLCGLSHGMSKEVLLIQFGDDPVPLDYREFVRHVRHPDDVDELVAELATKAFEALQAHTSPSLPKAEPFLARINLGAAAAENEFRDLHEYYVETYEFRRAPRGEGRLVVGRKGAGKTAIFWQVRDRVRQHRNVIVLDLKPETYQLRKLKDDVLALLQAGTREHTITAFWEYMLYLEVCHKILETDKRSVHGNHDLHQRYRKLEGLYRTDDLVQEGDFSERLSQLLLELNRRYQSKFPNGRDRMSAGEVTELLYTHDVPELRRQVHDYMRHKQELWILIDNIDKGWPPRGITDDDSLMVRTLLEATRKLERSMRRLDVEAHTLVFLRNDVYELLIENTPDRGKEGLISIDWNDPDLLRQIVLKRLLFSGVTPELKKIVFKDRYSEANFYSAWSGICERIVHGQESSQYLIDRCMMRPRFLIQMLEYCISNAVNLGRNVIGEDDIDKGIYSFSLGLIKDISYEMRDVRPELENVLYAFIGASSPMKEEEVFSALRETALDEASFPSVIETLLWYGVLGFIEEGEDIYIHTVQYEYDLLLAKLTRARRNELYYTMNPAFWAGLEVRRLRRS